MKRPLLRVAAVLAPLLVLPAFAQGLPEIADSDGNGSWSLAELQTVYTDLTETAFGVADSNKDGGVDAAELATALGSGVIKPVQM